MLCLIFDLLYNLIYFREVIKLDYGCLEKSYKFLKLKLIYVYIIFIMIHHTICKKALLPFDSSTSMRSK